MSFCIFIKNKTKQKQQNLAHFKGCPFKKKDLMAACTMCQSVMSESASVSMNNFSACLLFCPYLFYAKTDRGYVVCGYLITQGI